MYAYFTKSMDDSSSGILRRRLMSNENAAVGDVRRKGGLGQRIAYACGNLGQAAFYNAMSKIG